MAMRLRADVAPLGDFQGFNSKLGGEGARRVVRVMIL